jgi:hypothetical protein
MKNLFFQFSAVFILFFVVSLELSAQGPCVRGSNGKLQNLDGTPCINTVTSAVPFLRIVPDARSGAMGDAGLAISPDANAMHFNASKLAFATEKLGISATYTPWLRALGLNDVYLAYISGYKKIDDRQAIGASLRYFSLGSIQFTDANGQPLTTGRPNEFEVNLAYARKLSDNFSAAISGKFIYSNLAAGNVVGGEVINPGIAGAADISFTYNKEIKLNNTETNLTVALAMTNIGSKISYTNSRYRDFLPANMGLGAAWTFKLDQYNKLTLTTDVNKFIIPTPCQGTDCDKNKNGVPDYKEKSPIAAVFSSFSDAPDGISEELKELMFSFGAEYWYDNQFAVRAGYFTESRQKGARQYLTLGLGLKYNIFGLNFSYLVPTTNNRNPLDNTLRFSLLFNFADLAKADSN